MPRWPRTTSVAVVALAAVVTAPTPATASGHYGVSAAVQPSSVLVGRHVTVGGRVTPAAPGQVVKLQVATDEGWHTVLAARLGARSRFLASYTPPGVGTYELRVRKPASPGERRGTSPIVTVTVSPSLPPS